MLNELYNKIFIHIHNILQSLHYYKLHTVYFNVNRRANDKI